MGRFARERPRGRGCAVSRSVISPRDKGSMSPGSRGETITTERGDQGMRGRRWRLLVLAVVLGLAFYAAAPAFADDPPPTDPTAVTTTTDPTTTNPTTTDPTTTD